MCTIFFNGNHVYIANIRCVSKPSTTIRLQIKTTETIFSLLWQFKMFDFYKVSGCVQIKCVSEFVFIFSICHVYILTWADGWDYYCCSAWNCTANIVWANAEFCDAPNPIPMIITCSTCCRCLYACFACLLRPLFRGADLFLFWFLVVLNVGALLKIYAEFYYSRLSVSARAIHKQKSYTRHSHTHMIFIDKIASIAIYNTHWAHDKFINQYSCFVPFHSDIQKLSMENCTGFWSFFSMKIIVKFHRNFFSSIIQRCFHSSSCSKSKPGVWNALSIIPIL